MKHTAWLSLFPLATLGCLIPLTVKAQVTPDGATSTTVNQDGNNFTIEQGDRINDNLFHSFNEFSVPTLGSAVFNNAGDIANIFSRVTGSSVSSIDGLLSANGAANLFLINPNGIIFGQNARLNLGGSFFASTADSLLFEGNAEFSAVNPQAAPLLEVSIPIGLNFRDNPAPINIEQQPTGSADFPDLNPDVTFDDNLFGLRVPDGKTFALAGGDITADGGGIVAVSGRIELGAVRESGTLRISFENDDISFNFPDDLARANVSLINDAGFLVMGSGGGDLTITANNIEISEGSGLFAGIFSGLGSADAQAGDINLNATGVISISQGSGISNQVNTGGIGNSGNIIIDTTNLSSLDGSPITASVFGTGNAGNVTIDAANNITFQGVNPDNGFFSGIANNVEANGVGDAGDTIVTTANLNLVDGGGITSNVFGKGNAGNISIFSNNIEVDGGIEGLFTGLFAAIGENAAGQGGNIFLGSEQSPLDQLNLTNGAQIVVSNFGQGEAGSLSIFSNNIEFDGGVDGLLTGLFASVGSGATGKGGNINLGSEQSPLDQLNLTNGGQISVSTFGQGNAGDLSVFANNIELDGGDNGILTGLFASVGSDATGQGGDINLGNEQFSIQQLTLNNRAQIVASTFSEGDAGNLSIFANNIELNGGGNDFLSGFFASVGADAMGQGGNVFIDTDSLTLTDGGRVAANVQNMGLGNAGTVKILANNSIIIDGTNSIGQPSAITSVVDGGLESDGGIGNGGEVIISTGSLSLINGGRISATSLGQGNGGDLTINASESIFISGFGQRFRSGISVSAFNSDGNSGNANINTGQLTIENGGTIEASNIDTLDFFDDGTGQPGNINIQADSITLNNEGRIDAVTQSEIGDNANINLVIAEDIILRNNSLISATALENADGGNVTINADDGLIIAFPNQNNDIIANANRGNGGRINITTQAIFGLEERPSRPPNQTNDIDASSEFGLQGDFSLNTPEVDPTSGLIELPASVGDASDQISQNPCEQGVGSEFTITGKGGLPPNVNESLNSESAQVGLIETVPSPQQKAAANNIPSDNSIPEAVPAMGWVFNDKGEVTLTAYSNTDTEIKRSPQAIPDSCSAPKNK